MSENDMKNKWRYNRKGDSLKSITSLDNGFE